MSRPCVTKQLPLILFSVYSVTVKTPALQRTRYASYASPYIMLAFFFPVYFSSRRGYLFLFCHFRSMPYIYRFNDRYSSSPRVGSVDVATSSFIPELVF
jgi:hypothetical protein